MADGAPRVGGVDVGATVRGVVGGASTFALGGGGARQDTADDLRDDAGTVALVRAAAVTEQHACFSRA